MSISMEPSRLKLVAQVFVVLAAALALVGLGRFSFSAEERINAAFPPSAALEKQMGDAMEALPRQQRGQVRQELASRMKLRALTCAKGYSPAWGGSLDEIRRNIADSACFAHADEGINRWLGIVRIAPLLAAPPLRPLPGQPVIRAPEAFHSIVFAQKAGVALLSHDKAFSIIDLNNSKTLLRVENPKAVVGKFSPNGRIFTVEVGEAMEVRRTEDGALVATLPKTREHMFHWLDDRTAVFMEEEASVARLLDFSSLKEVELQGVSEVNGVLPVPGKADRFVVGQVNRASLFQIDRSSALPQVLPLLINKHPAFSSWSRNASSRTADGLHYVSHTSKLEILSVDSLRLESVDLGQFWAQITLGTRDPDKIFFSGVLKSHRAGPERCYLYSISRHSFAELACDSRSRQRPQFVPALATLAFLVDGGIDLAPNLGEGEFVSHYDQVRAWYDEDRRAWEAANVVSEDARIGIIEQARIMRAGRGASLPAADASSVLYKCQGPDSGFQFQATPCQPGREAGQVTVQAPPRGGLGMDSGRARMDAAVARWEAQHQDGARQREAKARAPRVTQPPEFRYVPPEITEPEKAPAMTGLQQHCPHTPIEGQDDALESEKYNLYTELFYVDPWKDSVAALGGLAADEFRVDEESRRARCDLLMDEYRAMGDELLRVYPKSLASVRTCFREQSRRLDAEGRRLGCRIERVIGLRK